MIVNHIDNNCDRTKIESYNINNLELLTVKQNLTKYKTKKCVVKLKRKKYTKRQLDKLIKKADENYEYYRKLGNKNYGKECKYWRTKRAYYEAIKRGLETG